MKVKDLSRERLIWIAAIVLILYLIWFIVKQLITPLVLSFIFAYLFRPIHKALSKRISRELSSVMVTIAVLAMAIGAMVIFFCSLPRTVELITKELNYMSELIVRNFPQLKGVISSVSATLLLQQEAWRILHLVRYIPKVIIQFLVFIISFGFILYYWEEASLIISRFSEENSLIKKMVGRADKTLYSVINVWFTLSLIKALLMSILSYFLGLGSSTSMILGTSCFFLELLPVVGGWIVWLTLSIYLLLHGSVLYAVIASVYGFLLISPVPDLVLRPKMISKGSEVNQFLLMIGMVGGLMAFGIPGLLIGPVVFSLLVILLKEYLESRTITEEGDQGECYESSSSTDSNDSKT
ncbi:hypothetical protein DRN46_00340 [Thermococci archaeon]|nr:MAG: hypothetical protein DRN46_00340 [Thermococci archaeon]